MNLIKVNNIKELTKNDIVYTMCNFPGKKYQYIKLSVFMPITWGEKRSLKRNIKQGLVYKEGK